MELTPRQQEEFLSRGFSRRSFGRIAAMVGAGASALPFFNEGALAQLSRVEAPPDAVLINANENPLGPCNEAKEAAHNMIQYGGRYRYSEADKVQKILAEQEGLKPDYIKIHPGSSGPLHQAVLGFTSPTKALVIADPGYEAAERAAKFIGSKVVRIPLTKDYQHDVRAMAAVPDSGLIYVVNPNNPTGTLTKQADLEWLVANKPKGSVVMIDEAYMHIAPNAVFNSAMVAADKDVIILRTFSKIYGMAGLRAGAAFARPDLQEKINGWSTTMMPITGMAAASASLQVKNLIPERRKIMGQVRDDVQAFFDKHNVKYVPSVSNCIMVDVKRPGREFMEAMAKEKIYVGRVWPSWPTYDRITVGTQEEMNKFKTAFLKVMA